MRVMLLLVAACGGKADSPTGAGSAWTEVPYTAPIMSKRMIENPYETNADPRHDLGAARTRRCVRGSRPSIHVNWKGLVVLNGGVQVPKSAK